MPLSAFVRWSAYLIADLTVTALSYPLAPFVVLAASRDGWLPRWLWWFQTPDNPLDGDHGWRTEHWQWRFKLPAPLARYIGRVGWLWRNNAYGFSIAVLGAPIRPGYELRTTGDPLVSNRPLRNGLVRRVLLNPDGSAYWQWYYVRAWSATRCLRVNLGWKLWGTPAPGERRQFVFSINPVMGYALR